ncbi:MAG: hypothetical protein KBT11_02625 [Treponema sp.]|nr:hypothetical protein [Candidatus Treponema equifaecale]
MSTFEIISYNANKLYLENEEDKNRADLFYDIMKQENKPHIILGQEVNAQNEDDIKKSANKIGEYWNGFATLKYCKENSQNNVIFYDSNIFEGEELQNESYNKQFQNKNSNFLAVKFKEKKTGQEFICCCVHISLNKHDDIDSFSNYIQQLRDDYQCTKILIGGDFNVTKEKLSKYFSTPSFTIDGDCEELQTLCSSDNCYDHFITRDINAVSKSLDYAVKFDTSNTFITIYRSTTKSSEKFYWTKGEEQSYAAISDHAPIKMKFTL